MYACEGCRVVNKERDMMKWVRKSLVCGALLLALGGGTWWSVTSASGSGDRPLRTKQDVLAALSNRSDVLINIQRRLFPATWDLTLMGQKVTPALRRGLLGNTSKGVRWRCAQVLTQLRDASARGTLHRALGDWSDVVRGQVLRALAEIGDTTTVPHLIARLKDVRETPTNRVLAIRALGRLSSAKSVVWLKKQYKDYPKHAQIRREVVQALWMSRDVVKKYELYVFFRGALSDKDPMVMRKAAIYLGRLRLRSWGTSVLCQRLSKRRDVGKACKNGLRCGR
jgi:hypothetical protein